MSVDVREDAWLHEEEPEFTRIVARVEDQARAEERVRLLAVVYLVVHGLGAAAATIVFLALAGTGLLSGDPTATWILGGIGAAVAALVGGLAIPGMAVGIGLLRHRPWARTTGIVLGSLSLLWVPLGTVVGVLTLYVLLQDDVRALFSWEHRESIPRSVRRASASGGQ
ncbi:MAG: hypothetical protein GY946_09735 [bacterium]|nr:hypothetical protein [bacterium]